MVESDGEPAIGTTSRTVLALPTHISYAKNDTALSATAQSTGFARLRIRPERIVSSVADPTDLGMPSLRLNPSPLSWKMRSTGIVVHQSGESVTGACIESELEQPFSWLVLNARNAIGRQSIRHASYERPATRDDLNSASLVDGAIAVNNATNEIPQQGIRDGRHLRHETLSRYHAESAQLADQDSRSNLPDEGAIVLTDRRPWREKVPHDLHEAFVVARKAQRAPVGDASIGEHQSENICHAWCPGVQATIGNPVAQRSSFSAEGVLAWLATKMPCAWPGEYCANRAPKLRTTHIAGDDRNMPRELTASGTVLASIKPRPLCAVGAATGDAALKGHIPPPFYQLATSA